MQPISDKNLDNLFKERFENFQTEPSSGLWSKINKELNEPVAKKKSASVYWMSAASVLILLSASLYFYKPIEVIKLHGKTESQVIAHTKPNPVKALKEIERSSVNIDRPEVQSLVKNEPAVYNSPVSKPTIKVKETPILKGDKSTQILVADNQEKIKNVNQVIAEPIPAERLAVAAELPQESSAEREVELPKRRVKGIGGLVNFVIAQVDKREDKLIEFKDSDEGSEISGINLGLVKFKSRNK